MVAAMHWGDGYGWHAGWMWVWWVLGIVVVAALVWGMVRAGRRRGRDGTGEASAEEILKERYARGEIDGDEYQARLRDLRDG